MWEGPGGDFRRTTKKPPLEVKESDNVLNLDRKKLQKGLVLKADKMGMGNQKGDARISPSRKERPAFSTVYL